MIEGQNIAAKILEICSKGKVKVQSVVEAQGIEYEYFTKVFPQIYKKIETDWIESSVNIGSTLKSTVCDFTKKDITLPDYKKFTKEQMIGPSRYSNYLIPR